MFRFRCKSRGDGGDQGFASLAALKFDPEGQGETVTPVVGPAIGPGVSIPGFHGYVCHSFRQDFFSGWGRNFSVFLGATDPPAIP